MTSKNEFNDAKKILQKEVSGTADSVWSSRNQFLRQFNRTDGWTLLNELLQNAVDEGAKNVEISLDDDSETLEFRHDADPDKSKLGTDEIVGLCAYSKSSKGLETVGFMGIGFKSFLRFFREVNISQKQVDFTISVEDKKNGNPNLPDLYSPVWNDSKDHSDQTVFIFSNPRGDAISTLEDSLEVFDPIRFAVLATRQLKQLKIGGRELNLHYFEEEEHVEIELNKEVTRFLVLEQEFEHSEGATNELKTVRDSDSNRRTIDKKVRLIKKLETEETTNEDGGTVLKIRPTEMDGQLFSLAPLDKNFNFPFKFGLDADWLLVPDRTRLDDGPTFHMEILSQVPILIRRYIERMPDFAKPVNRKEWLDVFPNQDMEIPTHLDHLETDEFKQLMIDQIGNLDFIKCTDEEIRSPSNTRALPSKPPHLPKDTYSEMADKCFKCPIADQRSISKSSLDYFTLLELLMCPGEHEVDTQEVRSLWDPKKLSAPAYGGFPVFANVLDFFSGITGENSLGPEIVPLQNGQWQPLFSPNLVFQPAPKLLGKERVLHQETSKEIADLNQAAEVHDGLKPEVRFESYPGGKWRDKSKGMDADILETVSSIASSSSEEDMVLAIYNYSIRNDSIRNDLPELVRYLHTPSGCMLAKECFIGPPYERNQLLDNFASQWMQSDKINKISKNNGITHSQTRKFLIDVGAKLMQPIHRPRISKSSKDASDFIKKKVDRPTEVGSIWRATYSCENEISTKDHWTLNDYEWPYPLSKIPQEKLSQYLSNPNPELCSKLKNTPKKKAMSWFYGGDIKKDPGRRTEYCTWINDLRDTSWVRCSDGTFQKPEDAPIQETETSMQRVAEIDDDVVKFYTDLGINFGTDLKGMTPEQCIEHWKTHRVLHDDIFIQKMRESGLVGPDLETALLQSNHRTEGGKIAPLSRFVERRQNTFGGYFGILSDLPDSIRRYLRKMGIDFRPDISSDMLQDFINHFESEGIEIFEQNLNHVRKAYSRMIEGNSLDLSKLSFLTYGGKWMVGNDVQLYLQLTDDRLRFQKFHDKLLRRDQFPLELDEIRKCYLDGWPIFLLDNEFELDEQFPLTQTTVDLNRVLGSLEVELKVHHHHEGPIIAIHVDDDKEWELPYLVNDEGDELTLYLHEDTREWAQHIADLISNIAGLDEPTTRALSQALSFCDHSNFSTRYAHFCSLAGKQETDPDTARGQLGEPTGDDSPEAERPDRTPIVRKPTSASVQEDEGTDEDDRKKRKKSQKKPSKSKPRIIVQKRRKKSEYTSIEIGDEAEETVEDYLTGEGWEVINRNKKYGKAVEGPDLEATKDNEKRYIEVKGMMGEWTSSQDISWKQAAHALQNHDPENRYGKGRVTCWLYVVELVFDEEEKPRISEINWPRHKPRFHFPPYGADGKTPEWKGELPDEEE